MKKRRVVVLGATGSIGESAQRVAADIPDRMEIVAMSANQNAAALSSAAKTILPQAVCLVDVTQREALDLPPRTHTCFGEEGLLELATLPEADLVLIAIVGTAGLAPALAAIEAGKDIAVASKEILVMAGEIVMRRAKEKGVRVLPIDSEHNAIFQCLEGRDISTVRRLILTASGGPFRKTPAADLANVTLEQALKHPTWNMGRKITIDCATLFNKGLEMLEAHWLFGVPMSQIEAIVHPQSIVHSMVEFVDGSVLAQLSHSDMCFPIQYAVTWPDRITNNLRPLDFAELSQLTFEAPRTADFPALDLARQAGDGGGTLPAVFNAANEIAVERFLGRAVSFPDIWRIVAATMHRHEPVEHPTLEAILAADAWARHVAREL
ncbi:MAG TPA: 1-deoxy-D-xylulose-5-phosphate reductoisomerase [Chthoniobacterales bacterium]